MFGFGLTDARADIRGGTRRSVQVVRRRIEPLQKFSFPHSSAPVLKLESQGLLSGYSSFANEYMTRKNELYIAITHLIEGYKTRIEGGARGHSQRLGDETRPVTSARAPVIPNSQRRSGRERANGRHQPGSLPADHQTSRGGIERLMAGLEIHRHQG